MISSDPRLPQLPFAGTENTISTSFWRQFSQRFYELWRELVNVVADVQTSVDAKVSGVSSSIDGQIVCFSGTTGDATFASTAYVVQEPTVNDATVRVSGSTAQGYFAVRTAQADGPDTETGGYLFDGNESTSSASENNIAAIIGETEGATAYRRGGRLIFQTKPNGNASLTERMRIASDGAISMPDVYSDTVGATNRDLFIDDTGALGYVSSVRASKTNIAALNDVSWLQLLKPVRFNYRKQVNGQYTDEASSAIEYGLIAEEVNEVAPELCFYDVVDGNLELRGVSYSKLIAPMLKYIQELEKRVSTLEK